MAQTAKWTAAVAAVVVALGCSKAPSVNAGGDALADAGAELVVSADAPPADQGASGADGIGDVGAVADAPEASAPKDAEDALAPADADAAGVDAPVAQADAAAVDDGQAPETAGSDAGGDGPPPQDGPEPAEASVASDAAGDSAADESAAADADDAAPEVADAAGETAGPKACAADGDCAALEDGNPCNGTLYCDLASGACAVNPASIVTCDPAGDTACLKNTCQPKTGSCAPAPVKDGVLCSDGQKCTEGDVCIAGKCEPGEDICVCKQNADCATQEDGNACNGTLFCNKATGKCQVNPATLVNCPNVDDTACLKNTCQPKTGKCKPLPAPEGLPCDDGNPCTVNEGCLGGACTATANTCECQKDADCLAKDDGNLCNGILYCNLKQLPHVCELNPTTLVKCQTVDDGPCAKAACQPKTGQCVPVPLPDGATCDADGSACTDGDTCKKGQCQPGASVCECTGDADCQKYEDANPCNGTLYCNKAINKCLVNPATLVHCPFGLDTACAASTCDPLTGTCAMQPIHEGQPCDADGSSCTPYDACQSGKCAIGANVCECQKDADCAAKEDGDACNGTLVCDTVANKCTINPATVVACPDIASAACLRNTCQPATGTCALLPADENKWCDGDANPCTLNDTCHAGKCVIGKNFCACTADDHCAVQDDGSLCNGWLYCDKSAAPFGCAVAKNTIVQCGTASDTACLKNKCQPLTGKCGMAAAKPGTPCDDGSLCTAGDACQLGLCGGKPANCDDGDPCSVDGCLAQNGLCSHKPANCDDANACTDDACDPKLGCSHKAVAAGSACDDGQLCTQPDVCSFGACKGAPLGCDDGKPCTTDTCDPQAGCGHAEKADGAACSDGNACTQGDTCSAQKCIGKPVDCDDGQLCSDDGCDAKTGACQNLPNALPCDDGNTCTGPDACTKGACKGGPLPCDDQLPCTIDGCDAKVGCKVIGLLPAGATCSDGDACSGPDGCDAKGGCAGAKVTCDDANACTADACDAKTGCASTPKPGPCTDGNACTKADQCQADGGCKGTSTTCDDGNACTDDGCDPAKGCTTTNPQKPCTSANLCLIDTACKNGACQGGHGPDCDDGVACTVDACDPAKGCSHAPDAKLCDDGDPCTDQACDAKTGCANPTLPDGSPCASERFCSAGLCVWATQVDAGFEFACAVRADGTVWCWGQGDSGQLANQQSGSLNGKPVYVKVPTQVAGVSGAIKVSVGHKEACALTKGGQVYCWGANGGSNISLGTDDIANVLTTAKPMKNVSTAVDAWAGANGACARLQNGDVVCAGGNSNGEFALGATTPSSASTPIVTGWGGATDLAVAHSFLCGVVGGVARCAGWNIYAQTGSGSLTSPQTSAVAVKNMGPARQVAAGYQHACALGTDGAVKCWGSCSYDETGTGKTCPGPSAFVSAESLPGMTDVRHLDAA
ncbi:MAG: hypothetical protein FJ100_04640 [Deltaproteobacteria bacterium]|nr:hypothetical protein [Deltaproteobacteria bacterium]